ncbi:hypothetical protein ACNRWW_18075 [Metabacillus sp. HB246100]|uniref:hypothetical protein n=1 Tax=Bacillus weihaiensis TaxID=1547283 RepID=UPI002355F14F|nr:hypothetical protein [Bacillus weihaiensis]
MLNKSLSAFIFIGEWIGFLSILLLVFIINLIYFTNIVFIDMTWEEPTTLPFINSILLVLCIGIICFFYIKNLAGNRTYKKLKKLFGGLCLE